MLSWERDRLTAPQMSKRIIRNLALCQFFAISPAILVASDERSANYCEADIKVDHMSHRRSICLIVLTNLVGALAGLDELHNRGASVDLANFGYVAFAMLAMTILADAIFVMNF